MRGAQKSDPCGRAIVVIDAAKAYCARATLRIAHDAGADYQRRQKWDAVPDQ